MNNGNVKDQCHERQNDEEDEDCDPSGQSDAAVDLAVVDVVNQSLRYRDKNCYCRQHNDRLL